MSYDELKQPGEIKALLIPCDDAQPISVVSFHRDDTLRMQQYIGGDFQVIEAYPNISIWVNESGKVNGLAYNKRATVFTYLYRSDAPGTRDPIVGNALLLGTADEHGNTLSVPDEIIVRLSTASMP